MAAENDDIFTADDDGEDDLTATLREQMDKMEADPDEEDRDGLTQPPAEIDDKEAIETVTEAEGRKIADDVRHKIDTGRDETTPEPKAATDDEGSEAKAKDKSGDENSNGDDTASAENDKTTPETEDLTALDTAALLKGVQKSRRGEIERRLLVASEAMKPFNSDFIRDQMKEFGKSPVQVASRLVELAAFAKKNPGEYIAWVTEQSAASPEKVVEVLNEAAKHLGLSVSSAESDDDDPFKSDRERELEEEIAVLRGEKQKGRQAFGPDTDERVRERTVQEQMASFIEAKDDQGQPLRPYWSQMEPAVTRKAAAHMQTTGQRPTFDDLGRFYDQSVAEMMAAFGNAAKDPEPASDPKHEQARAAADKAAKASKSIDGSGQTANRRPANAETDDSIEAILGRLFAQAS